MADVTTQAAGASPAVYAPEPILDVSGVTLQYKTKEHLITATYRVDFKVFQSDRFVLLGPSGCGKSTLLKGVAGYLNPVEGEIRLKGHVIRAPGPDRVMVFQEFDQLLPWKTVKQNITFALLNGGKCATRQEADDIAMEYIRKVKLDRFEDTYPHMLSGGMKQRVAIARGMAMEPDILLMDEPFASLDEQTRLLLGDKVIQIQQELRQTTLLITHNITEAVQLSDRILVMTYRPGTVKRIVEIKLPRPRTSAIVTSDDFGHYVAQIWSDLREEATKGLADDESHLLQSHHR
jgi:sulfonate transport system ATP-binding protein